MIEPFAESTNNSLWSRDLTNAAWAKSGSLLYNYAMTQQGGPM